jgi:hypothetical protein
MIERAARIALRPNFRFAPSESDGRPRRWLRLHHVLELNLREIVN